MKKHYVLLLLCTFYSFLSFSAVEEKLLTLHFNSDKFRLTEEHNQQLEDFLNSVSLNGDYEFQVRGHTDQDGSQSYNLKLSQNRALSICSFLYQAGVNSELTSLSYAGELELAEDNLSSSAKSQNRRVQVIYKKYSFQSDAEVQELLSEPYKTTEIYDAHEEHLLRGKKGTELNFQSNCFLTETGEIYSGSVNLELNEALDLAAFLAHGLSTVSDGEMLISGGMIKITAFDSELNPLVLDSRKPISISMPTVNMRDGMNVFLSEDGTDWEITSQKPNADEVMVTNRIQTPPDFKFKEPKYEGERKPSRPTIIANPRMPNLPDSARFFTNIPWYSLNKKELEIKQKNSFNKAVLAYKEKVSKFQRRTTQRAFEVENFDERMALYKVKLEEWEGEFYSAKMEYMKRALEQQYAQYIHKFDFPQKYNYTDLQDTEENAQAIKAMNTYEAKVKNQAQQKVNYAFSMASLGWVNIDCFSGNTEAKKDVLVSNSESDLDVQVKLLFPEINSCLSMGTVNFKDYVQQGVPVSQNPTVVAYKLHEGSIYYCETTLDDLNSASLKFEYLPFSQFEEKIKTLA